MLASLQIGADQFEHLVGGFGVESAGMRFGVDEMRAEVLATGSPCPWMAFTLTALQGVP